MPIFSKKGEVSLKQAFSLGYGINALLWFETITWHTTYAQISKGKNIGTQVDKDSTF